ncbi:hypothetical protein CSW53_26285 (plasmid) [Rhodococcus ruber]|nr:hypothetical protein CSW53_26285 [Rhodococcus ruber]
MGRQGTGARRKGARRDHTRRSALVARWRALPESEKVRRRRAAVVDHVIHSMAMEGDPVSDRWIEQARQRQRAVLGSH